MKIIIYTARPGIIIGRKGAEIEKLREDYARKFNHDIDAIYKDIKRREAESGREFVSFPPRKVRQGENTERIK